MTPEITSQRRERPRPDTVQHHGTATRLLLAAGIVGPVLFVLTFTVAGWLRPGYSALASAVSDLGVGSTAWIQNANFLLFGILLIAFAAGFRRVASELIGGHATGGAILIATTGIGMLGAVLFPAKPPTEILHFLLGFLIVIVSAIAAAFYLGRQFRRVPEWRVLARYSTWTGLIAVALVLVTFVALNPASPLEKAGVGGLINRILAVETFAWYAVTGYWLWRHTSRGRDAGKAR
ncbi:putative membrane protein [Allocatelliglobosispora scoriae]|uniref:Putative membrane protein n=1 Tax=Allocatelliglobosispora scoriae TaxID=643052 RepID=A0A841BLP4_9ACTN|nr:DUF998 domain-containing protein [Allocatelliglobosispora scoriae]MBB5867781.1 putative membrane protein [Allocatelliglobosispora scoriae]